MAYSVLGRPVWTERRYDRLAADGYTRNVVAYRAIQVIARGAASVPWLHYKGKRELDAHPLLALPDRPNPRQSGAAFIERQIVYFLVARSSRRAKAVAVGLAVACAARSRPMNGSRAPWRSRLHRSHDTTP